MQKWQAWMADGLAKGCLEDRGKTNSPFDQEIIDRRLAKCR
ncbi:MAG TPA: hypothetical protein VMS17_24620 [Gemmataceae bacterium]|nr:hypothetical protein [Gemmataceae bacterium]